MVIRKNLKLQLEKDHVSKTVILDDRKPYETYALKEADIHHVLYKDLPSGGVFRAHGIATDTEIADFLTMAETSGRVHEYEIKVTAEDFKEDFKKPKHKLIPQILEGKNKVKHPNRFALRNIWKSPNHFTYVVPDYLYNDIRTLVPEYAGVMIVCFSKFNGRISLERLKKSPLLHKEINKEYWQRKFIFCLSSKVQNNIKKKFEEKWEV